MAPLLIKKSIYAWFIFLIHPILTDVAKMLICNAASFYGKSKTTSKTTKSNVLSERITLLLLLICIPVYVTGLNRPVCSVAESLLLTDAQSKHFHLTASKQEQAGGTQDPQIATLESCIASQLADTRSHRSCIFFHNDFEWRLLECHSLF